MQTDRASAESSVLSAFPRARLPAPLPVQRWWSCFPCVWKRKEGPRSEVRVPSCREASRPARGSIESRNVISPICSPELQLC